MIDSSLILVPASCRGSEESITVHHPGEAFEILKTVQSPSYLFRMYLDAGILQLARRVKGVLSVIKKHLTFPLHTSLLNREGNKGGFLR